SLRPMDALFVLSIWTMAPRCLSMQWRWLRKAKANERRRMALAASCAMAVCSGQRHAIAGCCGVQPVDDEHHGIAHAGTHSAYSACRRMRFCCLPGSDSAPHVFEASVDVRSVSEI